MSTTHTPSTDMSCSPSLSTSVELLDDASDKDVRRRILASRLKKKAQISAFASLGIDNSWRSNPARLTWIGVDDSFDESATGPSRKTINNAIESRHSDDDGDDDADSTILGHYIQALPIPPPKTLPVRQMLQPSRSSYASEDTCGSSHESSSQMSCLMEDDDTDAHSLHTTTVTESSSGPPSRRSSSKRASSIASNRHSNTPSCRDFVTTTSSRPNGPPPSMPLPPMPLSPPLARSPSAKSGEFKMSQRSSGTSALTIASSRSSVSERSSWKSSGACIASPPFISDSNDQSASHDVSDEELDGIRDISKHFPAPTSASHVRSSFVLRVLDHNRTHSAINSESSSESSLTKPQSRRLRSTSRGALISVQESSKALPSSDEAIADNDHISAAQGEQSNDSSLSDVLNLTDNKGVLVVGRQAQPASSLTSVSVARVGLGARTLLRHRSELSMRSVSAAQNASSSPRSKQQEVMRDSQEHQTQISELKAHIPRNHHHQRNGTISKSMSELMAALDLDASEWGQHLGESESLEFRGAQGGSMQARESQLLDAKPPRDPASLPSSNHTSPMELLASDSFPDSMPSLSSSGSQELSLDDSRGPATAESSLIRSNSAKSAASLGDTGDTAHKNVASGDYRSIYNAYRGSTSTMASCVTAPVVRIEDPEGDELSDSELDGDASSSDDMPRKRNKPSRKKRLGFEQQRATLRPRPSLVSRSASLSSGPSKAFQLSLEPTQEEDLPSTRSAPTGTTTNEGDDPYAFYEFSPSLPPFMPAGLSPLDLTGRGTWSSIVARASERMRSRQPSVASLDSFATSASGPVSLRQIRASARAKQRHADAAHRAREQMSDQFAAMSYRPFAIHDHAASFASQGGVSPDLRSSISSVPDILSPAGGLVSGRSSALSIASYADSMTVPAGDYGTRWPVAVGADESAALDDATSMCASTYGSLSRTPSSSQPTAKKYVEFSMQTSPQPSPTESRFAPVDTLTVDDATLRADAQVGTNARSTLASHSGSSLDYLGIDAPLSRRKSAVSLLSMHDVNAELDEPGVWPLQIRAPRLSSMVRRRSDEQRVGATNSDQESGSDNESDLDVGAKLEDLAERSGVLDVTRGFKRKMHSTAADAHEAVSAKDSTDRPIASIPARSRRISAALDRIRAQRGSRGAGWVSSDDEEDTRMFNTPRRTAKNGRPSLPGSAPNKITGGANMIRRSKSMASMGGTRRDASAPSMLRVRSPSPDLSILSNPSDDEEMLLTADIEMEPADLSHKTVLDEEFDMMVGQTITSRFSSPAKPSNQVQTPHACSDASSTPRTTPGDDGGKVTSLGYQTGFEDSKGSQQTVHMHSRSRASSMSSVIEMIQEADELLSSTGHSIGHSSSGHETSVSDSGGTSGHDPPRPNQAAVLAVANIVRRRESTRSKGLPTPVGQPSSSAVAEQDCVAHAAELYTMEAVATSPSTQETPDTMAGSEIWTSFHVDRSSNASTATTWSYRSVEDAQPPSREPVFDLAGSKSAASPAERAESADQRNETRTIPVLRRKSSGLPVARSASQKQSRPSLPLPSKAGASHLKHGSQGSSDRTSGTISPPSATIRRYQSVASLRTQVPSDGSKTMGAGQGTRATARYSDGPLAVTPSKAIRSVGGGVTPSKLPSLKASISSLPSAQAARSADKGARECSTPQRLPVTSGAGRSRLPSPRGKQQTSGLPRLASSSTST